MKLLAIVTLFLGGTVLFTAASPGQHGATPGHQGARGALADIGEAGEPIFALSGLAPGRAARGSIDVSNAGDDRGHFTLVAADLVESPASPGLSAKLHLVVEDLGHSDSPSPPVVKYRGKLAAMRTISLGTFQPSDQRRYRFTATFPRGTPDVDNQFQGARSVVRYSFNARTR